MFLMRRERTLQNALPSPSSLRALQRDPGTSEHQMLFLAITAVLWGMDRLSGIFLIVLTLRNNDLGEG